MIRCVEIAYLLKNEVIDEGNDLDPQSVRPTLGQQVSESLQISVKYMKSKKTKRLSHENNPHKATLHTTE